MTTPLNRIFCVDDERDILDVAQMCLELMGGFTVETFESGAEVLERLQTDRPDLLLLDVMMPGMNGPTVLENVKKMSGAKPLPVIFMTARTQASEVNSYLKCGAISVVAKPFDPMTLSSDIQRIWETHHADTTA